MALDAQTRRVLRSLQLCLDSSLPAKLLQNLGRNDAEAWGLLSMREVRMLVARGQTYQARQFGSRLPAAAEAGLPVDPLKGREYPLLNAGIDSVLAGRHYLALRQLGELVRFATPTVRWGALLWQSRALADVGDLASAMESCEEGLALSPSLGSEAGLWAGCFRAEIQGRMGEGAEAEDRILQVLSCFVDQGDERGTSFAYATLAVVASAGARVEEGEAAAELAQKVDGSWAAPAFLLARYALGRGDVEAADQLLRSIPNPSADVFYLKKMLVLARQGHIFADLILQNLELAAAPPTDPVITRLGELLERHPEFIQARVTLFWKLLLQGRPAEAERQIQLMVDGGADGQSIAAARFSLGAAFEAVEDRQREVDQEVVAEALVFDEPTAVPGRPEPERPDSSTEAALALGQKSGAFTGQLSLFGVPDLLQFLCGAKRTGLITFSSQQGDARIRLHDGCLHAATSPSHPSLQQFLLGRGLVVPAPNGSNLVSELRPLLGQGFGELAPLAEALGDILRLTVKEVGEWSDGWFMFDRIDDVESPPPELLFPAHAILLDAFRELDEERR